MHASIRTYEHSSKPRVKTQLTYTRTHTHMRISGRVSENFFYGVVTELSSILKKKNHDTLCVHGHPRCNCETLKYTPKDPSSPVSVGQPVNHGSNGGTINVWNRQIVLPINLRDGLSSFLLLSCRLLLIVREASLKLIFSHRWTMSDIACDTESPVTVQQIVADWGSRGF